MPRPLLAPDPRQDTTIDVPWDPGYTGPRYLTRTTYQASAAPSQSAPASSSRAMADYWGRIADEDARRWNANYGLQERQQQSAESERQARIQEAARQLAENRRQYDLSRADRAREFDANYGLNRDQFGLDVLKTGASLRGPRDWIQGDMFAQGATTYSPYLQSLQAGTVVPYGGGTARPGNPTPLTVGTMANALTGGASSPTPTAPALDQYGRPRLSPTAQAAVDATANVWQQGIANRPLGWWESMTKGQQDAFRSQSDYLGEDTQSGLEYLRRSRPGQRSALSA